MTVRGSEGVQFRPTVVLCLDTEGRATGEWLSSLLPSLDAPLRDGVALLGVNDTPGPDGALTGAWLEHEGGATGGDDMPPVPLSTCIIEALRGRRAEPGRAQSDLLRRGVLDDAVISRVKEAGYGMPRGMVVVWIVAAASSPRLERVIAATRAALRSDGVEGWVLLALTNTYPLDPAAHLRQEELCAAQPWDALLVGGPTTAPPVTFAYLFETHDERGHFWEGSDQTSFAAAEAIFTLTASGLTLTREYEETLRRSMPRMVSAPQERMSSVATSRLTFPRSEAERYCAYQLGATILREWTPEQEAQLTPAEQRAQENAADAAFQRIMRETADSNALVATLRGRAQRRSRRQARENELPPDRADAKLVMRWLARATVEPQLTPQRDLPAALEGQRPFADEGLTGWEEALFPAWSRYADEVAGDFVTRADDLVLEGAPGVERAYAYVSAFNEALREEQDSFETRKGKRLARRALALGELEKASEGPWLAAESPADATQPVGAALTEDPRETRLSARLATRWRWIHARQPHPATLITAVILATATLALLALVIAPVGWLHAPLLWLWLTLAPLLVTSLAAFGYARYRRKLEGDAATDLYHHHRAIYRYRIEQREAEWRATAFEMLRVRCERILERLAHWEQFIAEITNTLVADAEDEERRLFDGAVGRRDVLVANRRRLTAGGYALRDFEVDVSKRRQAQPQPETPWHASPRELLARLRDALHGSVSLVEAPAEAIAMPARDYCLGIVRPYFTGDLVNLTDALDTLAATGPASLLDALVERAVLLYHPADQPRPATTFVIARAPDQSPLLRGKQLDGLITLNAREREWLALARLLPGGARPDFLSARAETTQAPIAVAPDWTAPQRAVNPANPVDAPDADGATSQNGGTRR
jgi:hypothetical protein